MYQKISNQKNDSNQIKGGETDRSHISGEKLDRSYIINNKMSDANHISYIRPGRKHIRSEKTGESHITDEKSGGSQDSIASYKGPDNKRYRSVNSLGSRFRYLLLLSILFFSWAGTCIIHANATKENKLQEGIAKEIIRFHVIANSDSTEDQELKYKVKDALVEALSPKLKTVTDISEGRAIITSELDTIQTLAQKVIAENGYNYSVNVSLEPVYFPMKVYGDYTFPPGTYEALRVRIGEAEGKNWWCVMFPPLCFVDETYSIVDSDTEDQLKCLLTEEEYNALKGKKVSVKCKFKLWESIKKLFS